jgi:hypothetical protein
VWISRGSLSRFDVTAVELGRLCQSEAKAGVNPDQVKAAEAQSLPRVEQAQVATLRSVHPMDMDLLQVQVVPQVYRGLPWHTVST